jgi:hypothetical protein
MFRSVNAGMVVGFLMFAGCSRVLVADAPPEVAGDGEETESVGGAEPSSAGGAGGSGPVDPPPTPLVDTGTLSVAVSIAAGNWEPSKMGQADVARVGLSVTVTDRATGAGIADAEVRGGPPGGLVPLLYDVYSISTYGAEIVGYAPVWELSIVRGADRLEGLLVASPSYISASAAIDATSGLIGWAPATELGVTARVCATTTNVPPPYTLFSQLCVDTVDSGALALDAEQRDAMFPFTGTYWVVVERILNQPTSAGDERTASVFASLELAL